MFKDPLVRRFISASFFAGTFVWVAVTFFDVETEVVWVLLVFSILFVLGLIVVGLIGAPLIRLFRRKSGMLAKIEADLEQGAATDEKND